MRYANNQLKYQKQDAKLIFIYRKKKHDYTITLGIMNYNISRSVKIQIENTTRQQQVN